MNEFGETMQKFLQYITKDQNIEDLDDVELPVMNGRRKWWRSQVLQPSMKIAYYDNEAGHYVLGDPINSYTWESEFTTTSAAALTLTCPAGYRMEVHHAAAWNATQASVTTLTASISGNTLTLCTTISAQTQTNGMCIGASIKTSFNDPCINMIGLSAGDSLTMTLGTYAAGNNTEHYFVYKLYRVA